MEAIALAKKNKNRLMKENLKLRDNKKHHCVRTFLLLLLGYGFSQA